MDKTDEAKLRSLARGNTSTLFLGDSEWFTWPRDKFLQVIEENKFRSGVRSENVVATSGAADTIDNALADVVQDTAGRNSSSQSLAS
jgi:hypothetical protein